MNIFVLTTDIVFQYTEEANKNHAHHKEEKPADCVDQGEEINLDNLDTTIRYYRLEPPPS